MAYTAERKKVLIFTAGVAHGKQVEQELRERHGAACAFITGSTPAAERAEIIARFRDEPLNLFHTEPLKYLINVNVLTITHSLAAAIQGKLNDERSPGLSSSAVRTCCR